ncbi:MAG: hypothetical protein IPJ65_12540 [Archangiaceae bacterium]|nr:hypothetical protein [Archangiaceae bacterium]
MRPLLVVAAALCVVSCNCGSKNEPVPGSGMLCGDFSPILASMCGVLDRCKDVSPYPIAYTSRAECTDILCWALTCRYDGTTIKQSIPQNDAQKQAACSQWLDQATCAVFKGSMAGTPCDGVLLIATGDGTDGPKKAGEACNGDTCAKDLFCPQSRYDADAGLATCRTCTPLRTEGQACGSFGCVESLNCEYQPDAGASFCRAPHPAGFMCNGTAQCLSGFCNYRTFECDDGGKPGDPCTAQNDCRSGNYCGSNGTCTVSVANGGPCTDDAQCLYAYCDQPTSICGAPLDGGCSSNSAHCASLYCNGQNHCDQARARGESCTQDAECTTRYCSFARLCADRCTSDAQCDGGFCDFGSSECRSKRPDGQGCDTDHDCLSENCSPDDVCVTPKGPGGACTTNGDCTFDAFCLSGTCQARGQPGASCTGLDTCLQPYVCIDSKCTLINLACRPGKPGEQCAFFRVCDQTSYCDLSDKLQCKARAMSGAMCSSDDQCLDGYCESSLCVAKKPDGQGCSEARQCKAGSSCVQGTCKPSLAGMACDTYDLPCPSGYWCTTRDVCAPDLQAGESCSSGSSREHCAAGLYCDQSGYKCAPRLSPDAGCDGFVDFECTDSYYCDRSLSPARCAPSPGPGESCDFRSGCAPGLYCYATSCVAKKANGEHCSDDGECASATCDSSVGCVAGSLCVP